MKKVKSIKVLETTIQVTPSELDEILTTLKIRKAMREKEKRK